METKQQNTMQEFGPWRRRVSLIQCPNLELKWVASSSGECQSNLVTNAAYDVERGRFFTKDAFEKWMQVSETQLKRQLSIEHGISEQPPKNELNEVIGPSPMKLALNAIHRVGNVDKTMDLAGYGKGIYLTDDGKRILVPNSPKVIKAVKGLFPFVGEFLKGFFATPEQLDHFYYWLSWGRKSFLEGTFAPGHALIVAGPHNCGKNALIDLILKPSFGGRQAHPYQYMKGLTPFNNDLISSELLVISDEPPMKTLAERVEFGAKVKDLVVNESQRSHAKGKDAMSVKVFTRLVMALNDDDDSMNILPEADPAIMEKMMLMVVAAPKNLPSNGDPMERLQFAKRIADELPALLWYVENDLEFPREIRNGRLGVSAYHNPLFREQMRKLSANARFLDLLDRAGLFDGNHASSRYSAKGLYSKLITKEEVRREVERYYGSAMSLGKALSKAAAEEGSGVIQFTGRSRQVFYSFEERSE